MHNTSTADRLDRVQTGQWVNLDSFTLTDDEPEDGWIEVVGVIANPSSVMLILSDETSFTAAPDRLIRIGWTE